MRPDMFPTGGRRLVRRARGTGRARGLRWTAPAAALAAAALAVACSGAPVGELADDPTAGAEVAEPPAGFRGLIDDERLRAAGVDAEVEWTLHVPTAVPEDVRLAEIGQQDLGRAGTGVVMHWDVRRDGYVVQLDILQIAPDADRPDTSRAPPALSPEGEDLVTKQVTAAWGVGEVAVVTTSEEGGDPRRAQASWAEEGRHFTAVAVTHVPRDDLADGEVADVPAVDVDDLRVVVESFAPLD